MAEIEVRLPKMGESVTEATITSWLKEVGEKIEVDEPLVEVATDKVDNELPSEFSGVLVKKLFEKDTVAQVGDVIAIINSDSDANVSDQSSLTEETTSISIETENQLISNSKFILLQSNKLLYLLKKFLDCDW